MHRFSAFWHMRLPHRLQGQKVKSQSHGAGAYCGGHLAAQLVIIITFPIKAYVMSSFAVILSFVLSFCKQDNWRTRKRTSTKLGRHTGRGDPLEVTDFWWWSSSVRGFWISFIFFTTKEYAIFGHLLAFLCFINSHTINSRFVPYLARWLTLTR